MIRWKNYWTVSNLSFVSKVLEKSFTFFKKGIKTHEPSWTLLICIVQTSLYWTCAPSCTKWHIACSRQWILCISNVTWFISSLWHCYWYCTTSQAAKNKWYLKFSTSMDCIISIWLISKSTNVWHNVLQTAYGMWSSARISVWPRLLYWVQHSTVS